MKRALLVALGLWCALPCFASAQAEEPLGTTGQWLLGGSVGGSLRYEKWKSPPNTDVSPTNLTHWSVWVAPEALVFVATDFAVGARVSVGLDRFERWDNVEFRANTIGGGVLLAYRIGLGTDLFLLPELTLGAVHYDRTTRVPPLGFDSGIFPVIRPSADWRSATLLEATLTLPFAWVLAPHFFAGLGPYVRALYGSGGATPRGDDWSVAVGISTLFGTWL